MRAVFQTLVIAFFITAAVMVGLNAKASGFDRSRVLIDGHVFNVEVARSDSERRRGLMFRTNLAEDGGMLFDFGETRDVAMWMKNTFISLDMLFIDQDGKIVGIEKRAVPKSEAILAAPEPVRYVLEINGGISDKFSLNVGDKVDGLPR
jgi:uncharacterized membrane protein (UPF0127 family)